MGAGYTRQSSAEIADSEIINAAPLNAEFNAIENAFHGTTGHSHDGTSGEGPKIDLETSVTGVLPVLNGGVGDTGNLAAIAALTSAADRVPYFTGSGVAALATLTAAARTFLAAVDAPAQRTALGLGTMALETATDYQPKDATLTALAGVSTSANKLIYATGSDTFSTTDITSAARNLLDDADASAMRTTLGTVIGTDVQAYDAATLKSDTSANLTAGYTVTTYDAGTKSSGTFTPDPTLSNFQFVYNGGAHTLMPPSSDCFMNIFYYNGIGAGTITTSDFTRVIGSNSGLLGDSYIYRITVIYGGSSLLEIIKV
jgi:hypothetical protein